MSKRGAKSENVVWSIDAKGEECNSSLKFPFYDIIESGMRYTVRFYGACAIHSACTIEEAQNYVRAKLKEGKY